MVEWAPGPIVHCNFELYFVTHFMKYVFKFYTIDVVERISPNDCSLNYKKYRVKFNVSHVCFKRCRPLYQFLPVDVFEKIL